MSVDLEHLRVGDAIPVFLPAPISRRTLALYAGASGDDNPVHIDIDFARQAGMGDVMVHGMLSMAYIGRLLTACVPQTRLRGLSARFVAIARVGETLTCTGTVVEMLEDHSERRARLDLVVTNSAGEVKVTGEAILQVG